MARGAATIAEFTLSLVDNPGLATEGELRDRIREIALESDNVPQSITPELPAEEYAKRSAARWKRLKAAELRLIARLPRRREAGAAEVARSTGARGDDTEPKK